MLTEHCYTDVNGLKIFAHPIHLAKDENKGMLLGRVIDYYYTAHSSDQLDEPVSDEDGEPIVTIDFQNGSIAKNGFTGISNEAMIAIVIHRLKHLSKLVPSDENYRCIELLQQAIDTLDARTIRRERRDVLGKPVR